jgi:hypothetical protein
MGQDIQPPCSLKKNHNLVTDDLLSVCLPGACCFTAALSTRLAASSGLFKWDQDLASSCATDAENLCPDELESDARLPSVGGFTISCLRQGTLGGLQAQVAGAAEEVQDWQGDLSIGCTQALFRREVSKMTIGLLPLLLEMAEAEDLRLSFEVSRGCSQVLKLHRMQTCKLPARIVQ